MEGPQDSSLGRPEATVVPRAFTCLDDSCVNLRLASVSEEACVLPPDVALVTVPTPEGIPDDCTLISSVRMNGSGRVIAVARRNAQDMIRERRGRLGTRPRRPKPGTAWALLSLLLAVAPGAARVNAEVHATPPVAEVNGESVTAEDLERALGAGLRKLEEQIYDLKRRQLDALIAERLLAQEATRRGTSVSALLDAEVTAKAGPVADEEVEAFYQEHKERLRGEEAALRPRIRSYLQQQALAAQRARFVEALRSQAKVVDRLRAPPIVRVDVQGDGAPVRGPVDAPVTLVEFSDFHCPFCKRVQATLTQLLARYPGKLKLVFRDFPIDSLHPQARRAAEAARCARDQGKFWEYHDVVFAGPPQAAPEDLGRYATQVGLDLATFEGCLSGGVHRAAVQRDVDEAGRLGLDGTPAFFINGRPLTGAQPVEAFARVIEEELAARGDAPRVMP
jgi:protein-disulfide isomerase